jgi:selenide, water dikinase
MNANVSPDVLSKVRLTSFSHGGGCGCKIAPAILEKILVGLDKMPIPKELLVGIETADDAAVYQINDTQAVVATTDFFMPIVDDPHDFGAIAATNAISDVYAMGATPLFALALVGMPINQLPIEVVRGVLEGGQSVCKAAGIPIAGGHTIDTVEPIYGLVVIGLVDPRKVKRNAGAQVGDKLILGKALGVGVYSAALKKEKLDAAGYKAMIDSTTKLNTPGRVLCDVEGVHSLTDVTGFGLAGHLLETTRGSKVGATVKWSDVPLHPGVVDYVKQGFFTGASERNWQGYGAQVSIAAGVDDTAQILLSDPQTSGGLLVACDPASVEQVMAEFRKEGFDRVAVIGEITAGSGLKVVA